MTFFKVGILHVWVFFLTKDFNVGMNSHNEPLSAYILKVTVLKSDHKVSACLLNKIEKRRLTVITVLVYNFLDLIK